MKSEPKSSNSQGLPMPRRGMDPLVKFMIERGRPVTRENYLRQAGMVEPLEAEQEALVQEALATVDLPYLPSADWPNEEETEESALRSGQLRLLQARHRSEQFRAQSLASSQLRSNTPEPPASPLPDNPPTE